MPFLKSVRIDPPQDLDRTIHPFAVPSIGAMIDGDVSLRFGRAVTVLVGDNGSGKSMLLEAVAVHQGMNAEGDARGMQFRTTSGGLSELHEHLRVSRSHHRPQDAFFLRAESFFNVASAIDEYDSTRFYGGTIHGQLQFLVRLHDLVNDGCQFVIATHSPLMAFPGATIYEFTDDGPTEVD